LLAALGRLYREAEVAVESNNHGYAALDALHNTLQYSPLFHYRRYDQSGEAGETLGWPTNARTKPLMLDELAEAIAEGLRDPGLGWRWRRSWEATIEASVGRPRVWNGGNEARNVLRFAKAIPQADDHPTPKTSSTARGDHPLRFS
jgi:hypothetical protein